MNPFVYPSRMCLGTEFFPEIIFKFFPQKFLDQDPLLRF